jgi:class 3 adenylate cyclase
MHIYQRFYLQCVRNLAIGVLLSILPAAAFYSFIFEHSHRQMMMLGVLGVADLAAFFPLDLVVLSWALRPVKLALSEGADREQKRAGLKRLLESPLIVIARVYLIHAPLATVGITLLVLLANRYGNLGIEPKTFPLYWILNLTMIPIAHMVYEFTNMERATQEPAGYLAEEVPLNEAGARRFTLNARMKAFFPVLALLPVAVMIVAIVIHNGKMDEETEHLIWDLSQIGIGCAALFLYLMWTLGGGLRQQTSELTRVLRRLGKGDLSARAELYTTSEFGELAQHINDMAIELNERARLRELFGAYMTPEVAHTLLAKGASLEGRTEKRYCAIQFVDIRGFTRFSSERPPDVVLDVLNRLLAVAADAITESGGTVNKYLGDGLLAVFGAPQPLENPCANAVKASIDILHRVERLNAELAAEGLAPMQVGIGLHAGEVVVGTIGSTRHKLEYTVIGDPVNVASRIEQLTKKVGAPLLVSQEVIEAAGGDWACHAGEPVSEAVRGLDREVILFPIVIDATSAASTD